MLLRRPLHPPTVLAIGVALLALAGPAPAQSNTYAHPSLGGLWLDFELDPSFAIEIDEGPLLTAAVGRPLFGAVAVEAYYGTAGLDVRSPFFETFGGRFHLLGAGLRIALPAARWLDVAAVVSPGVLIATVEDADRTESFIAPFGVDLVLLPDRRIRLRAGARDLLHLCEPPDEFDDVLCRDGEWLHHRTASIGVEVGL